MTKDEALKLALEALEDLGMKHFESTGEVLYKETFAAIKQALANEALEKKAENARELGLNYEPEVFSKQNYLNGYCVGQSDLLAEQAKQEPVAWMCADESLINKGYARFSHVCMGDWKIPVYTTKPQRTWVGLTGEEYAKLAEEFGPFPINQIEAKLKEKNHV